MSILVNTDHLRLDGRYPRIQGKTRDIFDLGDQLIIVATDRLSAFDVVLPNPIPGKGQVLHAMTCRWFQFVPRIVLDPSHSIRFRHHLLSTDIGDMPKAFHSFADELDGRAMLVEKWHVIPIEVIIRGHIAGSFWKDYLKALEVQRDSLVVVHGFSLPRDLLESQAFHTPIFTPSTKATGGAHDENISRERMIGIIRPWLDSKGFLVSAVSIADQIEDVALQLYIAAKEYAWRCGIIIADTKFEFGLNVIDGIPVLVLVDEVLTPDSSRFWPKDRFHPGGPQPSFDKQPVRDYLASTGWDKKPPAPELPPELIQQTTARYLEMPRMLFKLEISV